MSDLGMLRIRPCRQENIAELVKLAEVDNHLVIAPTHILEKNGQLVGYISLGGVPTALVWTDTKLVKARDSACLLNFMENTVAASGSQFMALPCTTQSPYRPFIERLGYLNCGQHDLLIKKL
jgi:hypothetical protein